jgi:PAS domain S-box-containing protein
MKPQAFLKKTQSWTKPPTFPGDEKKTFQAALLNSLVLSLLVIMLLVLAFTSVVATAKLPTNLITLLTILVLLVCKIQLQGGRLEGIKYAVPILLWVNSTVLVFWAGGTANISMIYYVITAVFVTLLFGRRGAVVIFLATAIVTFGIVVAETKGFIPERVFLTPPINSWLILILSLLISMTTLGLAVDSRENALAAARGSETKYRGLFEAITTAVVVMEQGSGVILDANSAAEELYGYSRQELLGKTIIELSAEPEETRRIIQSEAMRIPLCHHRRRDGSTFPVEIFDNVIEWEGKALRIGSMHDVSARLQVEERDRMHSQQLMGIIRAAEKLIHCETLDDVYRAGVELARQELALERCALYLLNDKKDALLGTYGTDLQRNTTDERTSHVPLPEGDRVIENSPETWNINYDDSSHWEEGHAVPAPQHWTAATFIRSNKGALGVFFNDCLISGAAVDRSLQEVVAVYCSLLGNIIGRKKAELNQQKLGEGLRMVIEAADELIRCADLNSFYRRAIELAQQKLGVERCGLFVYDNEEGVMHGTYGTDIEGNIVDESTISWPTDLITIDEVQGGRSWHVVEEDYLTLVGDEMAKIGHGWAAKTALRLGNELIGLFANDKAISGDPLDPLQQEIIIIYCSLLENIIKQKRTEAAFKQATITLSISEERYRQAIEAAGAVPYVQDYKKKAFTFMGENIFQLTGYSADEMTPSFWDTRVDEAIPGGDALGLTEQEAIPLARSGKVSQWQCDYRIRTRLGETRWVMDSAVEIFDEHNMARGSIGILQDITARKQAEAEREKLIAELETKNAELERFTYTVSHDLKSPLITIQGFLGYLEKDAEQGNMERLRSDMARIADATVRMQHLLNDLLELSRIGRMVNPPKHIPFSLIVEEALSLVKGRLERSHAQVIVADNLPFVYGDSARLVEVVQNLVDNAAKFMEGQTEPHIEIGWQGNDEKGYPIFFVRDNGMGIPPQYHERIFGLFNKLDVKSEGTGVGLALVKRIVEVHGGMIWIESDGIGAGATFYFTLPGEPHQKQNWAVSS